ncbi:hypothetical protein RSOLAG22IIIB_05465 [Rhizoctonia solani]|uniref:Uncharacterized protein n=1 Tax=Rhizoctonia solani TaxID=456999 RepID=A0A0K6G6Y1_9AGAM|nr:hypothetical protein RSOLAG22IIIB_05465 [Rhizoctonia solani]
MSDDTPVFDHYSFHAASTDELAASPASELMKFTGYFLDVRTKHFDWQRYRAAIADRPHEMLRSQKFESADIFRQNNVVSFIVNSIGDILHRVSGSDAGFDRDVMTARVENAFTSLEIKEESGFASWEMTGTNSAFTYRIMFDVPSNDATADICSLVTTVRIIADIYEKETWFGLESTSRHEFSADVTAIRLACSKDFIAGPKP